MSWVAAGVLAIPEILEAIFQSLDRHSNTSNAMVCKQWFDVALNALWCEVDNVAQLFNILAPVELECGYYKFTRTLDSNDWDRFDRYRFRVKRLSYGDEYFEGKRLRYESNVFNEIARSRTSLVVLPNLHTLEWLNEKELHACTIFMHANVKRLSIKTPYDDSCRRFVQDIPIRMPHLTYIYLHSYDAADIIQLLPLLSDLTELVLPPSCFGSEIVEATSRHQKLESIDMGRIGIPNHRLEFDPKLKDGAFPVLSKLEMALFFQGASSFLSIPFAPTNLTYLLISSPLDQQKPDSVEHLISVIARNCQLLRSLTLTYYTGWVDRNVSYDLNECVNLENLRPVFQIENLVHFKILHRYPLMLQLSDIEEIATSMQNVETLILNNQPRYLKQSGGGLTFDALLPFARHCHRLHTLGLYINAPFNDNLNIDSSYSVFQQLECFSAGFSYIEDEYRTVRFLSLIVPTGCTIKSEIADNDNESQQTSARLKVATEVLKLLINVRAEEREKARLLL